MRLGQRRVGPLERETSTLPSSTRTWTRLTVALALRAIVRPWLAIDLLRVAWRFRRRGWYRRPPFLPVPSGTYIRWRMYTIYGDEHAVPPADDVIRYARWVGRSP